MKIEENVLLHRKGLKGGKLFDISGIILLAVVLFITFDVLIKPLKIENKVALNKINEQTSFDYKLEVVPCTLYPQGGIIPPEGYIIPGITKSILLYVNTRITADKPVSVKGTQKIIVKLIADKLWEREYTIGAEKPFDMNGTENNIIDGQYIINLQELLEFVENVEKDTDSRADKYYLKAKPELDGSIIYENGEMALNNVPELSFEIGNSEIKPLADGEGMELKKEFIRETPVDKVDIIYPDYNLFGMKLPLVASKYVFSSISLLISIFCIRKLIENKKNSGSRVLTEEMKIDKKYKSRIIPLQGTMDMQGLPVFAVESFKLLARIADEKELPVIKLKNLDDITYCIMDSNCIYGYKANSGSGTM